MEKESLSNNIKILICCHKAFPLPHNDIFAPIQVGAAISDTDLGMLRDDSINGSPCDNISKKNKTYCELTAMYWAWKNIKSIYPNLEYIGLNHYRRYFAFDKQNAIKELFFYPEKQTADYQPDLSKIERDLKSGLTIVGKKQCLPLSLGVCYSITHVSEDIYTLKQVVEDLYPDYKDAFMSIIFNNNMFLRYNMFIMEWSQYDAYCQWLFSIIEETEKRINIESYNNYQKRIFGFMAERLFYVWIAKNQIRTTEYPVIQYDDTLKNFSTTQILGRNILFKTFFYIIKKSGYKFDFRLSTQY